MVQMTPPGRATNLTFTFTIKLNVGIHLAFSVVENDFNSIRLPDNTGGPNLEV